MSASDGAQCGAMAASRGMSTSSSSSELSSELSEDSQSSASDAERPSQRREQGSIRQASSKVAASAKSFPKQEKSMPAEVAEAAGDKILLASAVPTALVHRSNRVASERERGHGSALEPCEQEKKSSVIHNPTEEWLQAGINSRIEKLGPLSKNKSSGPGHKSSLAVGNAQVLDQRANGEAHPRGESRHRNGARRKDPSAVSTLRHHRADGGDKESKDKRPPDQARYAQNRMDDRKEGRTRPNDAETHSEPKKKSEVAVAPGGRRAETQSKSKSVLEESRTSGEAAFLLARERALKRAEAKSKADGDLRESAGIQGTGEHSRLKPSEDRQEYRLPSEEPLGGRQRHLSAPLNRKDGRDEKKAVHKQEGNAKSAPHDGTKEARQLLGSTTEGSPVDEKPRVSDRRRARGPEQQEYGRETTERSGEKDSWRGKHSEKPREEAARARQSSAARPQDADRERAGSRRGSPTSVAVVKSDPGLEGRTADRVVSAKDGEGAKGAGRRGEQAVGGEPWKAIGSRFVQPRQLLWF